MVIRRYAQGATAGHLQQTPEKAASRGTVAVLAEHRIDEHPITIDGLVQVTPAASGLHVRLIEVPRAADTSCSPRPKIGADQRGEVELSGTDGLVADGVAALQ